MIVCKDEGSVPVPSCQHYFPINNLIVQMNYSKALLKDWKAIEGNAKKHLQGWTVGKIINPKPRCKEYMQDKLEGTYDGTTPHTE